MQGVSCKFTDAEVLNIIELWDSHTMTQADIARRYNTSRQYIHQLIRINSSSRRMTDRRGIKPISYEDKVKKFHTMYIKRDYGCWEWKGKLSRGYGNFSILGSSSAYVASWIIHRGLVPKGKSVLHKCDNPRCVNPDHLYIGDQGDNMLDVRAIKFCVEDLKLLERLMILCEQTPKNKEPKRNTICEMFKISSKTLWRIRQSQLWPCWNGVYQFNW